MGLMILFLLPVGITLTRAGDAEPITFVIHSFYIEGNTVLGKETLTSAVKKFVGQGKTAQDVELARDALEQVYHGSGYPTVLINIPEQTVDDGIVKLQVIESRIDRVHVTGNKYFTMEYIKEQLSGIQPGKILFLPAVREELSDINQNPDLKVSPVLIPGRELGTINVELKVEDKLPLHGYLELNNRSTHPTTETRLNGMISYSNLWQKRHAVMSQFQLSPQDMDEVNVFSLAYGMPAPWNKEHLLLSYYIKSDSDQGTGDGFRVIGKGQILGFRYMMPLPSMMKYEHSMIMGFDWMDLEEDSLGISTPIEYVPLMANYSSTLSGKDSTTEFSAEIKLLLRDMFESDMDEFQAKRAGSTGNFIYLVAGVEHRHKLPKDCSLFAKLDGQVADQPLVNSEQYSAGGVNSVRGYKESEILADNGFHGTLELYGPSLVKKYPVIPYLFYDFAWLDVREALPGQEDRSFIHGTGIGLTCKWKDALEIKFDLGVALEDTDDTEAGEIELHFKTKYQF